MDDHDSSFQNQAQFNFDSSRAKLRKAMHGSRGQATRSLAADFDLGLAEDIMESMNYKQLSRYVLEDVLSSQVGTRFMLCISKSLDAHHHGVISKSSAIQRQDGIGGEEVRILGETYLCLKTTIDHAPLHEELALSMSRKRLEDDFFGNGGGFILSVDGTSHKLTLS